MKKWIAFLTAVCMLVPMLALADGTATPTDECDHPQEEWGDIALAFYEDSVITYEADDDEFHHCEGLGYLIIHCDKCGQQFRLDNEIVGSGDRHEYNADHVCTVCGHACGHTSFLVSGENDSVAVCEYCGFQCPHAEMEYGECFDGEVGNGITVTAVDENTHLLEGIGKTYYICTVCGYMDDVQENVMLSRTDEHWFDSEDDVDCELCGYRKIIEEEPVEENEEPDEPVDEPVDEPAEEPAGEEEQDESDGSAAKAEEPAADDAEEAVKDLAADGAEIAVEITADEATGKKAAVITAEPKEDGEAGVIALSIAAENIEQLAQADVEEISVVAAAGNAGITMNAAALQQELAANPGAVLVIEVEDKPVLAEEVSAQLAAEYDIVEGALFTVKKAVLVGESDTETELNPGAFTLKMEAEYADGMKILFIDAEGNAADAEAEYIAAADDMPGYWRIPFCGAGSYLPVIPKA